MRRQLVALAAASLALGPHVAVGQPTPSHVAETFFAALRTQRWRDAAAMLDSASAVQFRDRALAILVAMLDARGTPAAMGDSGIGIAAVAMPAAPDSQALRAVADTPISLFSDVRTLGAIGALRPVEFAARYLEVSQRSLRLLNPDAATDSLLSAPRAYQVIGEVLEGDSLAHVLYRTTDTEVVQEPHSVNVLYLRRRGSEWRLLLPADLGPLPFEFWLSRDF